MWLKVWAMIVIFVIATLQRILWNKERLLKLLAIFSVLILLVTIVSLRELLPHHRSIGYAGVFILSFASSASLLFPVPGIAAVCAASGIGGLFPLWVILLASLAESMGELTGYLIGFSGRGFIENYYYYPRIERWMERRGWLVLIVVSSIPNFLFDIIGVAAGTLRYPIRRFLWAVWIGKIIKCTTIAYACFYGSDWVLSFINLD